MISSFVLLLNEFIATSTSAHVHYQKAGNMSEIVSEGYIEVLATPLIPFPFRHKHNAIMCDTFLYDFKQEHTAPIRFNEYSYHARILAHKSLRDSIQYQILGLNTY